MDQSIIDRIQKLLSLGADNANENEAESALRMAAKLAGKHGIAISDIDIKTQEVNVKDTSLTISSKQNGAWEGNLVSLICHCFDCQVVRDVRINKWIFFGMKSDLELGLWYFKYLRMRIIRIGKEKYRLVKERKSYGLGVLQGLSVRLIDNFYTEKQKYESVDTKALIVIKKEEVDNAVRNKFPRTSKPRPKNTTIDRGAFKSGKEDGENMPLSRNHITA